jgi:hypothetical protein
MIARDCGPDRSTSTPCRRQPKSPWRPRGSRSAAGADVDGGTEVSRSPGLLRHLVRPAGAVPAERVTWSRAHGARRTITSGVLRPFRDLRGRAVRRAGRSVDRRPAVSVPGRPLRGSAPGRLVPRGDAARGLCRPVDHRPDVFVPRRRMPGCLSHPGERNWDAGAVHRPGPRACRCPGHQVVSGVSTLAPPAGPSAARVAAVG